MPPLWWPNQVHINTCGMGGKSDRYGGTYNVPGSSGDAAYIDPKGGKWDKGKGRA